jgi:hypothetical protein
MFAAVDAEGYGVRGGAGVGIVPAGSGRLTWIRSIDVFVRR